MSTRTITVFSTKGKQKAKIETAATTWGELSDLVRDEGYDLDRLHATENINRNDLVSSQAILPEGPFTLFLRPKETKSGLNVEGLGFKQLRDLVKEHKDEEGFMDHLNSTGVNYTRLKTSDLADLLSSWNPSAEGAPEPQQETAPDVEETDSPNAIEEVNNSKRVEAMQKIAEEILSNTESEEVEMRVEAIMDELAGLKEEVQEEEEANRETPEEKAERLENERLEQEARDMLSGF